MPKKRVNAARDMIPRDYSPPEPDGIFTPKIFVRTPFGRRKYSFKGREQDFAFFIVFMFLGIVVLIILLIVFSPMLMRM